MFPLFRLVKIITIILRFRIDDVGIRSFFPRIIQWLFIIGPWRLISIKETRGVRIRRTFEALGPVFIKLGQFISTRSDIIPEDCTSELSKLQDRIPSIPAPIIINTIETTFKRPISSLFMEFDTQSLAAASMAQVHRAKLHSGEEVAVKVIRPGIQKIIRQDIQLIYSFINIMAFLSLDIKKLRLKEIIKDYQTTLLKELDLQYEAANASQMRRNLDGNNDLYIPKIYWDYTANSVMTMELIQGITVTNIDAFKQYNIDRKKLAEKAVGVFFKQVFEDGLYHADMHPGNIFISTQPTREAHFIAVDFGIIGSISPENKSYIARNLLAVFKQDYRKVALLHIQAGWMPYDTPIHELEATLRTLCEPIFQQPLHKISFSHLLISLFKTARRFNMPIQPELVLLQKTLLQVESIGKKLDPYLDLWTTATPFLEQWLKKRTSPLRLSRTLHRKFPEIIEQMTVLSHKLQKESMRSCKKHPTFQSSPFIVFLSTLLVTSGIFSLWLPHYATIYFSMLSIFSGCGLALLYSTSQK